TVSRSHTHDQLAVTALLKSKIAAALQENSKTVHHFSERWTDDHTMEFAFKTMGFSVSGLLKSLPKLVTVDVTLPFAAMMVKGMIESRLQEEIGKILDEAG
ncbi:MAG: polyhydroxyalkanoic acid system family protein, partial [Planctomycetaceae bacterium]|nr:polyhydroxyalkanoic acid system family protein [Planctomycetaceae bacterium]